MKGGGYLNLSNILTRIKLKLGLMNIATPFEDLDGTINTILNDITTPTFSLYYPNKETLTLNLNDLDLIEKTSDYQKVLLPDFKTRKLLYVIDVRYNSNNSIGMGYYSGMGLTADTSMASKLMLANAGANIMNVMIPKMTFKYEQPRVLYIYNAYNSAVIQIDVGFEHDKNLTSIPDTAKEEYLKLAILDVKENLYPTLKHYTEINTAIGNINLKLDDWAEADNLRKDLIDKWDDSYHLDMRPLYFG